MKLLSDKSGIVLEPKDCLIIEDAPTVIHSVRQVGFPVLAVATSYPPEKLTEANWRVKTLRLAEVHKAVSKLGLIR